jgi:hypothetical protein
MPCISPCANAYLDGTRPIFFPNKLPTKKNAGNCSKHHRDLNHGDFFCLIP